jgi:hypothetical protein
LQPAKLLRFEESTRPAAEGQNQNTSNCDSCNRKRRISHAWMFDTDALTVPLRTIAYLLSAIANVLHLI